MKSYEEVRSSHCTNSYGGSEFPHAEIVTGVRKRSRRSVDEVGNEEGDDGLVESIEHESEEHRSCVG